MRISDFRKLIKLYGSEVVDGNENFIVGKHDMGRFIHTHYVSKTEMYEGTINKSHFSVNDIKITQACLELMSTLINERGNAVEEQLYYIVNRYETDERHQYLNYNAIRNKFVFNSRREAEGSSYRTKFMLGELQTLLPEDLRKAIECGMLELKEVTE